LAVLGKIISGNMPLSADVEIISTDKATVSTNALPSLGPMENSCGSGNH
jgi:hypothetical protein